MTGPAHPTVHPKAVPTLQRHLGQMGLDATAILAAVGLNRPEWTDGTQRAPRRLYLAAKAEAARHLDDPWFGLRLST